ncbi:hypothetical protein Aca07nite_19760 [Actinoplanes capillaceus]|uniref:Uncharacterized protein n=1 Tax=Actinoplanes campanulatus TaxID=113559 RepID=A0ABQ3WCE5_9ACTN|nr:hypothetical protein [Actinoplanes capillaceus]GID44701.1 hypothetical protein Aca07nite_19760 [Actinoplanes capillaceus]
MNRHTRTTTTAHLHRDPTPHTGWCARNHQCGLTEHRSPTRTITEPLGGRAVLTRVRADNADYAEITIRVPLHRHDATAEQQLGTTLILLRDLLHTIGRIRPARNLPGRRPALGRREQPHPVNEVAA